MDEIDEEEPVGDDFLAQAIRAIVDHPGVKSLLDEASAILRDARTATRQQSQIPHYAECPPRPRNGDRRQPPPPPPRPTPLLEDPRIILGFPPNLQLTETMIKKRRRELAAIYHSDHGGSEEAMKRLNSAVSQLLAQLG